MAEYDARIAELESSITFSETPEIAVDESPIPVLVSKQTVGQFQVDTASFIYSSDIPGLPFLSAGSLGAVGTKWLVRASASVGGGPAPFGGARIPHIELISRRTTSNRNHAGCEYSGLGIRLPEAARGTILATWYEFEADGTNLEFRMRTTAGAPATFYDGMMLIAIPVVETPSQVALTRLIDYFGSQGLNPYDALPNTVVVPTGTPFATVWEDTVTLPEAGNYLMLASCQCKTSAGDTIQARLLVDGVPQKVPQVHKADNSRDIMPFIYEAPLILGAGSHTFRIEGGSAAGANTKVFSHARIHLIHMNRFEKFFAISNTGTVSPLPSGQYPTWSDGVTLAGNISPFSTSGEYVLAIGNCVASHNAQAGVMARIYNQTLGTSVHEYSAQSQVAIPAGDTMYLSSVGCELANITTQYSFDQVGTNGYPADEIDISYRDLILLGLYKKTVTVPSVQLFATDSLGTSESAGATGSSPGILSKSDDFRTGELTQLLADTPPQEIPNVHPRLWLTDEQGGITRLQYLRQQARYDDNGNVLPGTPSAFWTDLVNNAGNQQYNCWNFALKYKVTQNPAHLAEALAQLNRVCDENLNGYENYGLRMGVMVRQACFYYDWLYHDLTAAQRQRLRDYIMAIMYFALNDGSTVFTNTGGDWARNDPTNNYFMSWHEIGVYGAITLYHDVWPNDPSPAFAWPPGSGQNLRSWWLPLRHGQTSGPTYIDGWEYIKARLEQLVCPVWRNPGPAGITGGGWHEGSWYRPMWIMFETFRVLEEVAGYFAPMGNVDYRDFGYYLFHSSMPNSRRVIELGDSGTADRRKELGGNDRTLMLMLADKYRGETFAERAQWWLTNVLTSVRPPGSTDHQYNGNDFLFWDGRIGVTPLTSLPLAWFSASSMTLFSRDNWTDSSSVFMLHSQDRLQVHEHAEQNCIQIWNPHAGSSWDDRWVVGSRCAHGSSGENQGNDWRAHNHSTFKIGGSEQRYSGNENNYPGDVLPTGIIDRYSITPRYVYGRGDAKDAYRLGLPNHNNIFPPGARSLDMFFRETIHIPGTGVYFDYARVKLRATTPDGGTVPQTAESHLHYPKPQPVVSGDTATLSIGNARLYRKIIYPSGLVTTIVDENQEDNNFNGVPLTFTCVDETANLPVVAGFARLFEVFESEVAPSPGMSPITPIVASTSLEGATMDKNGFRYHVLFTSNQTGVEPANPFSYDVNKLDANDVHIIAGLALDQRYTVTETLVGGSVYRYSAVKAANGILSDGGGCMTFTPAGLPTQNDAIIVASEDLVLQESSTLLGTKVLIPPNETLAFQEQTTLTAPGTAALFKSDTWGTSESTSLTPPINGYDQFTFSEEADLVPGTAVAPGPVWVEKTILLVQAPMRPALDDGSSFFDSDPRDGAFFSKLNDNTDDTIVFTGGPFAKFAQAKFGLSNPGPFVGAIDRFQYKVRVANVNVAGSLNVRLQCAIDGLGLGVLSSSFREMPLTNNGPGALDILFTPVNAHIDHVDFGRMRLLVKFVGDAFGPTFLCQISEVYVIPQSFSWMEKVI